jgi:cell division septation protein DedD
MTADVVEHGYGEGLRQRTRRRLVAALFGAGVAAASAGGLWWTWHAMVGARPPGEVPLLKADGRPWKARPEQPGGYQVPNQDMFFYDPSNPKARIERLLPPPEEPLPRSALPVPSPAEPAPAPPQAPVPEEAIAAAPPPGATAEAPPPAAPAAVPSPPPVAVAPEAVKGGLRLQIASLRSPEAAQSEWERVKRQNGDLLGAFTLTVARHDDQRGTFYRVQVGPVADTAQAERICAELKRRNIGCNLVR